MGAAGPGTFADVSAAVDAVLADPALPDRCVLVGHSAGGHLVALAATRPEARSLAGVVALGGCVDLALTRDLGLGDGAAARFMGDADDAAWTAADPAAHPALTPVVLVHGDADDTVPPEVSMSYLKRQGPRPPAGAPPAARRRPRWRSSTRPSRPSASSSMRWPGWPRS